MYSSANDTVTDARLHISQWSELFVNFIYCKFGNFREGFSFVKIKSSPIIMAKTLFRLLIKGKHALVTNFERRKYVL